MISAGRFVTSYNSAWRSILPNSEAVIAKINKSLSKVGVLSASLSQPNRRAFLNEAGFSLFAEEKLSGLDLGDSQESGPFDRAVSAARKQQQVFAVDKAEEIRDPTPLEVFEIRSIYSSLNGLNDASPKEMSYFIPHFKGAESWIYA